MDDVNFIWKALQGMVSLLVAGGAWIMKGMHDDIRGLQRESKDCEFELQKFKTDVANTYAKDANVQLTVARLHERLDEMGGDIKEILKTVGGGKK